MILVTPFRRINSETTFPLKQRLSRLPWNGISSRYAEVSRASTRWLSYFLDVFVSRSQDSEKGNIQQLNNFQSKKDIFSQKVTVLKDLGPFNLLTLWVHSVSRAANEGLPTSIWNRIPQMKVIFSERLASWWLNQPIWNILVKLDHFPR